MHIMFLSRWLPYPADNGSKIRIFNILKQLAHEHSVTLLAFDDGSTPDVAHSVEALRDYCARVRVIPYRDFRPSRPTALKAFFGTQPRSLVDIDSPAMRSVMAQEQRRTAHDVLIASQLQTLPYAFGLPKLPAILEELELTVFKDAVTSATSLPRRLRAALTWWKLAAYIRRVLPRFELCTVASEQERALVRSIAGDYQRVSVIPNAIDAAAYSGDFGQVEPNTLVFSGSLTYGPNLDAAEYFLSAIYPEVLRAVPGAQLRITGRAEPHQLPLTNASGVQLTGHMRDIRPLVARSAVSVVPLRSGGGTRLKIIESMALGTPVVSTHKGAEGLEVIHGENILLADDPRTFAEHVAHLLRSASDRNRIGMAGQRLVQERYDWAQRGPELRRIIESAALAGEADSRKVAAR